MSKYFLKLRTPWISLSLLLFSYAISGYLLHQFHQSSLIYLLIGGYVLIHLIISIPPVQQIERTLQRWFGSDVIHLISILTAAFFAAVVLVWVGILENLLLILTAEMLARLDLQQAGLNPMQRLMVLTLCLATGLTAGWITNELVA